MKEKALTQREILFCTYYSVKRSAAESAFKAGYSVFPEKAAMKLLRKESVRNKISELSVQNRVSSPEVEAGLRRIAFGTVCDAVKIALSDETDGKELEDMDLFNISEIKVSRGKGVEIKFFDRIKALEKLSNLISQKEENPSESFFRAVAEGAGALRAGSDENK